MKLNEQFVIHKLNGEATLIPLAGAPFHGLGEGNETIWVILNCLTTDTTEEEIVNTLAGTFDGKREDMEEDVRSVINKLKAIGAIDE